MDRFILLIIFIPFVLFLITAIRGIVALRKHDREALTIEEGIEAIKQRMTARDYLQMVLVVLLVSAIVCGLYIMIPSSLAWRSFANGLIFALLLVSSGFLLAPWIHRFSTMRIAQLLDHASGVGNTGHPGNFRRLMRTYLYYSHAQRAKTPALFGWVRRQLGLYILGLDIRAYIPFSTKNIAKTAGLMTSCVMLLAVMLYFMAGPSPQYAYQFTEGTTPTEIDDESDYRGVPESEGDTVVPQFGADDRRDSSSPESSEAQEEKVPPATEETSPMENQAERPAGEDRMADASPADSDPSASKKQDTEPDKTEPEGDSLLSKLLDMLRGALPGQDEALTSGDDRDDETASAEMAGMAPGNQDEMNSTGKAPIATPGSGEQLSEQPLPQPGGGPSDPTGMAASTEDDRDMSPSGEGEGDSGRPRISSGGGGGLQGKATVVPIEISADAATLQLDVRQESVEGTKESEQFIRPRRYNALRELRPDDVTVTPADPILTQRIPKPYARTIQRLLSKP